MSEPSPRKPWIAIACGGTGGHLFPGIAVARIMQKRGCNVRLLISKKEIDRQAADTATGLDISSLPAVGLVRGKYLAFARGFTASFLKCMLLFRRKRPDIVLAMGGFTSAPPLLAARMFGAGAFLHESNSIPGKANRWLSRWTRESFISFPSAEPKLRTRNVSFTGTPVRPEFFVLDAALCRAALNLQLERPVMLIMGGSQGAEGINRLVGETLPTLSAALLECQWLHIAGPGNAQAVRDCYVKAGIEAQVHEFMPRMDLALGAASVAVSRAGASSLAEIAAARLPSILIPFPAAADNHQYYNARAYADSGAACLLEQKIATPEILAERIRKLLPGGEDRETMRQKLTQWQAPAAAEIIAEAMLRACGFENLCARRSASESNQHAKGSSDAASPGLGLTGGPSPMCREVRA